jgi:hypothetical protein
LDTSMPTNKSVSAIFPPFLYNGYARSSRIRSIRTTQLFGLPQPGHSDQCSATVSRTRTRTACCALLLSY